MIWDKLSPVYDKMQSAYNKEVFCGTGKIVAGFIDKNDIVLECACGTGAITEQIAKKCKRVVASDFSVGMLRQASKKLGKYKNVTLKKADITNLNCKSSRFDKVVAGNVIHLVPDPKKAMEELERVVKPGGKIIIPTYINMTKDSGRYAIKLMETIGIQFNRQFDLESYKKFFEELGYKNVSYCVVDGKMPCAIAVITKKMEGEDYKEIKSQET